MVSIGEAGWCKTNATAYGIERRTQHACKQKAQKSFPAFSSLFCTKQMQMNETIVESSVQKGRKR